jgi:hypothetical protein
MGPLNNAEKFARRKSRQKGGIMPKLRRGYNLNQTLQLLQEMAEGQHKNRVLKSGWTDVHTLLKNIPFDFESHLKAGRLKVVFEKAGADGDMLWPSIHRRNIVN